MSSHKCYVRTMSSMPYLVWTYVDLVSRHRLRKVISLLLCPVLDMAPNFFAPTCPVLNVAPSLSSLCPEGLFLVQYRFRCLWTPYVFAVSLPMSRDKVYMSRPMSRRSQIFSLWHLRAINRAINNRWRRYCETQNKKKIPKMILLASYSVGLIKTSLRNKF